MRIGLISDTHGQRDRTRGAVRSLVDGGAAVLIHCGDLVGPGIVDLFADLPTYFVFGNNDDGYTHEIAAAISDLGHSNCLGWGGEIVLDGKRFAVTHGHSLREVSRLLRTGPDYLLSGHSHIAADWREGVTRRINPGALHRAASFSVALLDTGDDTLKFVDVAR